jgi:hypothetical protein
LRENKPISTGIVHPMSFNNDDGNHCPSGYSTYGITTLTNEQCSFPFNYRGHLYYECITIGNNSPWCATTPDWDRDRLAIFCKEIKCFKIDSRPMTYRDAKAACLNDSANLASIKNVYEQSYLTALIRNKTSHWFGLSDMDVRTSLTFGFEDHSHFEYSSWAPNKPSKSLHVNIH